MSARAPAEWIGERRVKNDDSYTSGARQATDRPVKLVPIRPNEAPSPSMHRRFHFFASDTTALAGFCPLVLLLVGSCLQIGMPDASDGGTADAARGGDAGAPTDATAADRDAGGDLGCIVDPLSRVTLCTSIALCPGLAVDHDRFPHCGFRSGGGLIDLQCFCDNFLCPLGATLTCGQAGDLLSSQFEESACLQVNEGRCAPRSTVPPTGSTCDKNCAASCGGDLGCIRLCGC
jgi:hypothetical protein